MLAKTLCRRSAMAAAFAAAILSLPVTYWGEAVFAEGLGMVEDITVTARKRAESLEHAPR